MCIDIVEIGLGWLMRKIRLFLSARNTSVCYIKDNNLSKSQWSSPNLICPFILKRSALGLLIDKFRQLLTELSAAT